MQGRAVTRGQAVATNRGVEAFLAKKGSVMAQVPYGDCFVSLHSLTSREQRAIKNM